MTRIFYRENTFDSYQDTYTEYVFLFDIVLNFFRGYRAHFKRLSYRQSMKRYLS